MTVTAEHSFIRFHGRDSKHRYNYLYSKEELEPWVSKIKAMQNETAVIRSYFNNHYGAKAVVNALQFRELLGLELNEEQVKVLRHGQDYLSQLYPSSKLDSYLGPR